MNHCLLYTEWSDANQAADDITAIADDILLVGEVSFDVDTDGTTTYIVSFKTELSLASRWTSYILKVCRPDSYALDVED